ncbi:dihydroorotate dehydrogenase electron transfer subunit [bacterium]|nr:dihydroorotate dehydrogenase electron transfer subunit [bacterium]
MSLFNGKVENSTELAPGVQRLRITVAADFCQMAKPGQFVMLGPDSTIFDPLLKRPFGICNWGHDWFEVIIKSVGKGSRQLANMHKGAQLTVHGPLGTGYPEALSSGAGKDCKSVILVAGGIGVASIASCLLPVTLDDNQTEKKVLLYGAAGRDELVLLDEMKSCNPNLRIETITDDGSSGRKGFVTELLDFELQSQPEALTFACGPEPMLKSVQGVLQKYNAKGFISLENRMACGFGVCLGCVQTVRDDTAESDSNKIKSAKVCTQGPVFPAEEVIF